MRASRPARSPDDARRAERAHTRTGTNVNRESVDAYLRDGCGRCEHYRTPSCKVHLWTDALVALRQVVLLSELDETMKWGAPCYTLGGKNVVMVAAQKDFCMLSLFKGALIDDPHEVLERVGPNTNAGRRMIFRSAEEVHQKREVILEVLAKAIALERAGVKAAPSQREPIPEELQRRLAGDAALERAFHLLTPGRQRSHILHIGGAKQSQTRERRVEQSVPLILAGRGMNER
jgi:uncharacterized protein YdeI (YjbR/CyaY-like superfamily)